MTSKGQVHTSEWPDVTTEVGIGTTEWPDVTTEGGFHTLEWTSMITEGEIQNTESTRVTEHSGSYTTEVIAREWEQTLVLIINTCRSTRPAFTCLLSI